MANFFSESRFRYHGQLEDFNPSAAPIHTETGIRIIGKPYGGNWIRTRNAIIWHLETGDLDFIMPPAIPTQDVYWGRFGWPNAEGQIACSTRWRDEEGRYRQTALLLSDDDEAVVLEHHQYKNTYTSAINQQGQAVGILRAKPGTGRSWPYLWSESSGFVMLPMPEEASAQTYGINNKGTIVGGLWGPATRGAAWVPTDQPDQPYRLIELKPTDNSEETVALHINDRGQVLLFANIRSVDDKTGESDVRMQPFVWTLDDGYTAIPCPTKGGAYPRAMDEQGNILLRVHTLPQADPKRRSYTYYLHRAGNNVRLPGYPGASQTDYNHLSKEGLILGVARFIQKKDGNWKQERRVTFVLSLPDAQDEEQ